MSYQVIIEPFRPLKAKRKSSENTSKKQESLITSPEHSWVSTKKVTNPTIPSIISKKIWGLLLNWILSS